jgi:hypothetical protein
MPLLTTLNPGQPRISIYSSTPVRKTPDPYGALLGGITPNDFQNVNSIYQIGQPSARIDILQHIDISVQDLIRNKLAVGRLRDLADVEDIRDALAATSHPTEPNDE